MSGKSKHDILKEMARKLYAEASDKCFVTAFIAMAAIKKLHRNDTVHSSDTQYVAPQNLKQTYEALANHK